LGDRHGKEELPRRRRRAGGAMEVGSSAVESAGGKHRSNEQGVAAEGQVTREWLVVVRECSREGKAMLHGTAIQGTAILPRWMGAGGLARASAAGVLSVCIRWCRGRNKVLVLVLEWALHWGGVGTTQNAKEAPTKLTGHTINILSSWRKHSSCIACI
jgi:hypothetical protein